MLEVSVKCVIKEPLTSRYVMLLETLCGGYLVPVSVGAFEAEAIYSELNRIPSPRPMTYDFITSLLSSIGNVELEKIVIDSVDGKLFTASLTINSKDIQKTLDCRPSDAVALGLRMDTPIYIEDSVLDACKCISRECMGLKDEGVLNSILNDQGNTFWNV